MKEHDLKVMEKERKIALIQSIVGPRAVHLIGTKSLLGQSNLAVFNSIMHLGSDPALIGLFFRPGIRHTLQNLLDTGYCSLNPARPDNVVEVHETRKPWEHSEFEACGFTEVYHENHSVPFVKESALHALLKLENILSVEANSTSIAVLRVETIFLEEDNMDTDGAVAFKKQNWLLSRGLDTYFELGSKITQFEKSN
jgi:flavin reductase (DIM6/NTAB) family NADH-FMN oxidoreductase RutF